MEANKAKSLLILTATVAATIFGMFAVDTFMFTTMTYYAIAYWLFILLYGLLYVKIFHKDDLKTSSDYIILVFVSIVVFFISPPIHEVINLFRGK